jgi:hypothetical protein
MTKHRLRSMNAWVYDYPDRLIFRSYDTQIAIYLKYSFKLILTPYWEYSNSTKRQLKAFLEDYDLIPMLFGTDKDGRYITWATPNMLRQAIKDGDIKIKQVDFGGYNRETVEYINQ